MIRVAALEIPARWGDPRAQVAEARALLARAPCDVALLPEASLTGYVSPRGATDLRAFAEPIDGPTAEALAAMARDHGTHVVGPIVEREGERFFNTMAVFAPSGARVARYRKRHPWYPEAWATPGEDALPAFEIAGATLTICVCFDVHFVARESDHALRAADVLLFPSAWVEEDDSRAERLSALARRFDIAIVNANWGRGTPRVPGQGASRIVDRTGTTLAISTRAPERIDAVLMP